MAASKRVLTKWRKEALCVIKSVEVVEGFDHTVPMGLYKELNRRVLVMTQELLDHKLMED